MSLLQSLDEKDSIDSLEKSVDKEVERTMSLQIKNHLGCINSIETERET
jgi:hypothetical protein